MSRRALLVMVVVGGLAGCERGARRDFADVPVVTFDSLFPLAASLKLRPPVDNPIAVPASLVVTPELVIIADPGQASIGVFGRVDGTFRRRIGRAGDGPGEYRIPGALQLDGRGRLWILDAARQTVSLRDTSGALIAEHTVPGGWSGLALTTAVGGAVLSGHRAGVVDTAPAGPETAVLHELDTAGVVRASFVRVPRPNDEWKSSFHQFFVAAIGPVLAVGSYDTNAVRFHSLASGRDWTAAIGAPWYRPPAWPSDGKAPAGRSPIDAINVWVGQQMMIHALVPIDREHFLAVFHSGTDGGDRTYSYVVADTAGRSWIATTASPSQILQVTGDSAYALAVDSDGNVTLETRRVREPASIRPPQ